jgi:hypothetical protein
MFIFSRVLFNGRKVKIGDSLITTLIILVVLLLVPFLFPIRSPDLGSYIAELADYNYYFRLDFLSWASFKLLGISQEQALRLLAFSSLFIALAIVWYRRNSTFAAHYLIAQFPVLPMIIGSQIRLCLAVQCFMLMLVFIRRSKFIWILPGFFHASFWLILLLPVLPILIYFSDYIEPYFSNIGSLKGKISSYTSGELDLRSTFSGIDLLLCMIAVFISAFATNRKYPIFIGVILIILALFPDLGLPWVVVRRLTELYLVLYSSLYFLTASGDYRDFARRFYTLLHCCSYGLLFSINYLNYGFVIRKLNF